MTETMILHHSVAACRKSTDGRWKLALPSRYARSILLRTYRELRTHEVSNIDARYYIVALANAFDALR